MSDVIIVMNCQRDLVDRFRDAAATTPAAAKMLGDLGVQPSIVFSRLSAGGRLCSCRG